MSDRPLRIVHYLCRFRAQDGGVPRAVVDLANALADRGHEVTVLTWGVDDVPQGWLHSVNCAACEGVRLQRLDSPAGFSRGLSTRSRAIVRQAVAQADVVHLHGVWDVMEAGIAKACRRAGKPYLVTAHGMLDRWTVAQRGWKKRVFLAMYGRRMLEGAWGVHCTSQEEATQSERWYPRGRSVVLPLLADLSAYETPPGREAAIEVLGAGGPLIVYLGRLHPIKQIELLIDAMAGLMPRHPGVRLAIAGTGDDRYAAALKERARSRGIDSSVHWLGHVAGVLKVSLLEAADVFVLPSRHENWGIALVEAMGAGAPVVTTRGVNIWREVEGSGGAVVVEEMGAGLEGAIDGLLVDEGRRRAMGEAGRRWAMETLRTEQVVVQYEDVYREASGERSHSRDGRLSARRPSPLTPLPEGEGK